MMQLISSIDAEHPILIGAHSIPSIDIHLLVTVDTNVNRRSSWSFQRRSLSPEASPP
ncbi:hypothetical protein F2Q70_00016916 [Brassica cretica]|uniref:Uncharacterized protein n=1 Tax=Brassica cretica TaxID=69181 RepID=A0A8S9KPT3_BRACR|nr:hypothetical protein F2Q70_00016916 [Brassica cretica]KAF2595747.1 hypothetical protein F2Q68_00009881 [Brassica cretica]